MTTSQSQLAALQPTTRNFARVLGPFLAIVGITVVARASDMRNLLTDFESSPDWAWVTGAFVLMGGLVIIGLHQHWHGAAAVVVSLAGWLFALRGFLLLAFPKAFMSAANATIGMGGMWVTVSVVLAVAGLYLTYVGWRPASSGQTPKADATAKRTM